MTECLIESILGGTIGFFIGGIAVGCLSLWLDREAKDEE